MRQTHIESARAWDYPFRVRILEALDILEAATIECKHRPIDTPEVREALDLLAPYSRPTWFIEGFRSHLRLPEKFAPLDLGSVREGQQQNLRVDFNGIYRNVRRLLNYRLGRLGTRYVRTRDAAIKGEIDRLTAELATMPPEWDYCRRRSVQPYDNNKT